MKNIFKINCIIIMGLLFIIINGYTSCTQEDVIYETNQIPSWAIDIEGGESIDGTTDGTCDCSSSGQDLDCDYTYIRAGAVCETWGIPENHDEDISYNTNGISNLDTSSDLMLYCDIPVYYWNFEGYSSPDIEQIKVWGFDANEESEEQIIVHIFGLSGSNALNSYGSCYINNSITMSSCVINNISIASDRGWIFLRIYIPYQYDETNSFILGYRVCYDPSN